MELREELLQLIDNRLAEMGISAADASTRAVGNHYLIRNIRRRNGGLPSVESLRALCGILGLEFYIGLPRNLYTEPRNTEATIAEIAGNFLPSAAAELVPVSADDQSHLRRLEEHVRGLVQVVLQMGGDPFLLDVNDIRPHRERSDGSVETYDIEMED